MFELSEAQMTQFGLTFGVGGLIAYMFFIIYKLARESKAGKTGTFVLFLVLAFGMFGFMAKGLIAHFLGLE